jgi:hypothetical protein
MPYPRAKQVFDLSSFAPSDESRRVFHEGRDLVRMAHEAIAGSHLPVLRVLG